MTRVTLLRCAVLVAASASLVACGDDDPPAGPADSGTGTADAGPMMGADAGPEPGEDAGPGDEDAGTPDAWAFRTDAPSAYARVDRMGMPAVSTALISSKDDYNDDGPADDVAGTWVSEIVASLQVLHGALEDDFAAAGLTGCADYSADPPDPSACVSQEVAAGVTVADLVLPDTLKIDTTAASGFPNGRRLVDPVMDVTLAVILLDLETHAADALVGVNPTANDVAFDDSFPYLANPHD